MEELEQATAAVGVLVPALITTAVLILVWATLRLVLILSSEDTVLGVKTPQIKRLNPVVLAAKSDFKQKNTKILVVFIALVWLAFYTESDDLVLAIAIGLPIIQFFAGIAFWVQGRRAIKKERKIAKWWKIGDATATFEDTDSASDSSRDQYAYQQSQSSVISRAYDQLVYPRSAGWFFISAFAVLVAGCYALWLDWYRLPNPLPEHLGIFGLSANPQHQTVWGVFHVPVYAGVASLIMFLATYWLSFVKPATDDRTKNRRMSAAISGAQNGLGMFTLVGVAVLNLVAVAGVMPRFSPYRDFLFGAGITGLATAFIGLVIMGLRPMMRKRRPLGLASEK